MTLRAAAKGSGILGRRRGRVGNNELASPDDLSAWDLVNISVTSTSDPDPMGGTDTNVMVATGAGEVSQDLTLVPGETYLFQTSLMAPSTDVTGVDISLQDTATGTEVIAIETDVAVTTEEGWINVTADVPLDASADANQTLVFSLDSTTEVAVFDTSLNVL